MIVNFDTIMPVVATMMLFVLRFDLLFLHAGNHCYQYKEG